MKRKILGSLAALGLISTAVVALGAAPAQAAGCTITSPYRSDLNYSVTAGIYCANGYQFRAVLHYVDSGGGIKTAYGPWKYVGVSTATRPLGTLFNSGTYQLG